ncbi:APC family permease [Brevibacillus ginsengisoli]|uniref:APC family permease n=1 Tax=Brevibacillus ginsengisoli TaxID=363854 RepID=UPI003CEF1C0D
MNQPTSLKRSLTLFHVVVFGLSYMVPFTVFTTYGVATDLSQGMLPAAYVFALLAMMFTAYSYGRMSQAFPIAGSAYTYTQKAINPYLGFLVGWAILMDYLFMPMLNYLIGGLYLSSYFPSIPTPVLIILLILITTVISIFGVKVGTSINALFIVFQYLFLIVFVFLSVKGILNGMGTGTLASIKPFYNPDVPLSSIVSAASILCLSFLGFDAVTTISEETIQPRKTIPKAILIVTLLGGAQFIFIAYIGHMIFPNYHLFQQLDSASLELLEFVGGNVMASIFVAATVPIVVAVNILAKASVTRILYAMGRDSVLPKKAFAYIHPKFKTPVFNIILVGILSLSALFVDLVTATSFINFGALVAFTCVNLSVIAWYFVRNKRRSPKDTFFYLILPLIGAGFTSWLWTTLERNSLILGSIWVSCGFIYLLYITKMFTKRPPELDFSEIEQENEISIGG